MKIIGICGPSCSGKSSLAKLLKKSLDAEHLCLDDFYINDFKKIFVEVDGRKIRSYERPELYDGNRLASCIKELEEKGSMRCRARDIRLRRDKELYIQKKDYLIVEGFLLYQYQELKKLIDYKFYLELPFEKVLERRKARAEGGHADRIFEIIGFDENKRYCEPQKTFPGVQIVNADRPLKQICDDIIHNVKE